MRMMLGVPLVPHTLGSHTRVRDAAREAGRIEIIGSLCLLRGYVKKSNAAR